MDALLKKQLEIAATKVRMGVIEGVHAAKAGHPGGSLSVADTLTYLYMHRMNVDPKNPTMPDWYFPRVTPLLRFTQSSLKEDSSQLRSSRPSVRSVPDSRDTPPWASSRAST